MNTVVLLLASRQLPKKISQGVLIRSARFLLPPVNANNTCDPLWFVYRGFRTSLSCLESAQASRCKNMHESSAIFIQFTGLTLSRKTSKGTSKRTRVQLRFIVHSFIHSFMYSWTSLNESIDQNNRCFVAGSIKNLSHLAWIAVCDRQLHSKRSIDERETKTPHNLQCN